MVGHMENYVTDARTFLRVHLSYLQREAPREKEGKKKKKRRKKEEKKKKKGRGRRENAPSGVRKRRSVLKGKREVSRVSRWRPSCFTKAASNRNVSLSLLLASSRVFSSRKERRKKRKENKGEHKTKPSLFCRIFLTFPKVHFCFET